MKIGYVLKEFPRLSETFILTELASLHELGFAPVVFSRYRPSEAVPHAVLDDLPVEAFHLDHLLREHFWQPFEIHRRLARRFSERHDRALDAALAYRSRQELRYWMLAAFVAEWAADAGLDLLHAHFATGSASVARYASLITGIPFSFTAHAKDIYARDVDGVRLVDLLRDAATIVTVSEANLMHLRGIDPGARLRRVYNGIDLERFEFLDRRTPDGPPLLLSVARLVEKKGLEDLLDAASMLRTAGRDLRVRLVGSGPLEDALRRRAAAPELAGRVEFVGDASQEQVIEEHLPAAAVYVLPCKVAADGDRDGLPTTILESMARGVPVVSTTLPGVPEAVTDGETGLLCEPGSVADLAQAIERTLDEPERTATRTRRARRHVEHRFDSRRNVRGLAAAFREAVELRALEQAG